MKPFVKLEQKTAFVPFFLLLGLATALVALLLLLRTEQAGAAAGISQDSYLPLVRRVYDPDWVPPPPANSFIETFDGAPAQVTRWRSDQWDLTIHNRDDDQLYQMTPMQAQHGANCTSPDNTHVVTNYEDTVYQCNNHVMTATYGRSTFGGYSLIYLTPNQLLDTSGDFMVAVDVSTFATNPGRDWIDIWITPYDANLQMPLDFWLPDLQGEPREGLHFRLQAETWWEVQTFRNGQITKLSTSQKRSNQFVPPSKQVRTTHMLVVQGDRMRFGLPDQKVWWYDGPVPDFVRQWQGAVVQFGHHSYTPDKDCKGAACGPNTYHWDNVIIGPAAPFTMIHADRRLVTSSRGGGMTFDEPAPAGAHLRFAGVGNNLEISFDGGATWRRPDLQQARLPQDEDHFKSYWTPIPAGTRTVQFRGQNWWGGEWAVRDGSIWSRVAPAGDQNVFDQAGLNELIASGVLNQKTCTIPLDGGEG